ncbi:hypothetical protein K505DRAFT_257500, partial [Melanomma pulvis-pyrius CBS 109.77]
MGRPSRPARVAAQAKTQYMPQTARLIQFPTSNFHPQAPAITISPDKRSTRHPLIAVLEADPVDCAIGWFQHELIRFYDSSKNPSSPQNAPVRIPVVNAANEGQAGGDWELSHRAPEECFARRSNLVQALTPPYAPPGMYPIPPMGGIYTPDVYVFRDGPAKNYAPWKEMHSLPVISVAPIRRPRLSGGVSYTFEEEEELMREKMRSILRIAFHHGHPKICIGAFGFGTRFRNPVGKVAEMWKSLLFDEAEFKGVFSDVVFAIEDAYSEDGFDIFQAEFDISKLFPTRYGY